MHANAAALFEGNPDIDNILTLSPADRKSLAYIKNFGTSLGLITTLSLIQPPPPKPK
jgi:hypothetical protein